ncbi:MAG TPA: hypothetical protein VK529_00125 [Gemmatimonadaceae bacterium]|nr:hypothetical protein [Gemmatimonadaceae bacterium]
MQFTRSNKLDCRFGGIPGSFTAVQMLFWLPVLAWLLPMIANAQVSQHSSAVLEVGAQAIGVVTRESPAIQGRALTEGYVTQPAIMAELDPWNGLFSLKGTLNLEGATLKRGELNAGIAGEGYIDRRHPHTYLHEIVLTSAKRFGVDGVSGASITVGKGFAPFGTDDPMERPFEKYPINHHLAQILERAVAIGALRTGRLIFEGGAFNGDEPTGPGDTPNRNRYWDSWSGRITFVPWPQGEFQTSYARVKSPENPTGGGADQRKQSASIRLEDSQHSGYALFEWARTGDYVGSARTFAFTSLLAETWARYDRLNGALRIERTERPDEQRLVDAFRTPIPATDLSIAGRSRWTIVTARAALSLVNVRAFTIEPFAEVARARVSPTLRPSGFDPRQFYGSDRIWSVSVGAKLAFGMSHMRMGRYGVATTRKPDAKMGGMKMEDM